MGISSKKTVSDTAKQDILQEFELFNQPDYAFSPVSGGIVGWLFRHLWVIALVIILVIVFFNWTSFIITDSDFYPVYKLAFLERKEIVDSGSIRGKNYFKTESDVFFYNCDLMENSNEVGPPKDARALWPNESIYCITDQIKYTVMLFKDAYIYLIPLFSIMLVASILYTFFIQRAPEAFYLLAKTGRLVPREVLPGTAKWIQPKSSLTYVRDFESALKSKSGKIFTLLMYAIFFVLMYSFAVQRDSIGIINSGFLPGRMIEIFLIFIIPPVIGGFISLGFWVIIVVGLYLSWMPSTFKLNIQPYHSDSCGGLKPLGDIVLMMTSIVVVSGILLGIWAFRGLLYQSIPAVSYLAYLTITILTLLGLVTFLLPINRVHNEMVRQKMEFHQKYLEKASPRLNMIKNRLRQLVLLDQDQGEEAQALKHDLELLDRLYPDRDVFRTWPFGYAALAGFIAGQSIQYLQIFFGWVYSWLNRF